MSNKKIKGLKPRELTHEDHKLIIDEYYINGYNGAKAVQSFRPDITYGTARQVFNQIKKSEHGKEYLSRKAQSLRATASVAGEQLLRELLSYAYADATDYIELKPDELKALPADIRRSIQGLKHRKKSYKDRNGRDVTEEVIEIRLVDKLKAIDMINKHIGFYSEDNKQKQIKLDIKEFNVQELKVLQNILLKAENNNG